MIAQGGVLKQEGKTGRYYKLHDSLGLEFDCYGQRAKSGKITFKQAFDSTQRFGDRPGGVGLLFDDAL